MKKMAFENSKNSTVLAELKLVAHGADGFVLFPTGRNIAELGSLQALHTHLYYEFFFATDSPVSIVTETETVSVTHSVIIVPPALKHFSVAEGKDGYRITATESEVKNFGGRVGLLDFIKKGEPTVLSLTEDGENYLKKLVLADFFSAKGRAKGEALLKLLFLELEEILCTCEDERLAVSVNERYRNIERIDKYIGENYSSKEACVEELAKELCLSVRQTSRILKREYGRSFVELVLEKRMEVASLLLKRSNLSVGEILRQVGFETENYFFRQFKKYYGVTPLKYRKENR